VKICGELKRKPTMTNSENKPDAASLVADLRSFYAPTLLQNKVSLVTGASRGIGRAVATSLASLGAKVLINYAGNEDAANETLKQILDLGGIASLLKFDVGNSEAVAAAIKSAEKEFGSIDILINNAGISKDSLFVRTKDEDWDFTMNTNLKGVYLCSKAVTMGMMKKRAGKIVNLSSVIGLTGNAGQAAYAASKAGVLGLTKSLAKELSSRNIQVNAVAPGYISTDMTAAHGDKLIENVLAQIPAAKLGEPLDIAKIVVFLSSQLSDYVTGQTFAVDGGMTMV
jgi:3-oxoacyl-[acyl-carrier protein] reductase